jgi:hypothetical protein
MSHDGRAEEDHRRTEFLRDKGLVSFGLAMTMSCRDIWSGGNGVLASGRRRLS